MINTYIRYLYPGVFCSDESVLQVKDRTIPKTIPKGVFGFQFFDREVIEKDGEKLFGKEKNHSRYTYFGTKMTREQVENEKPRELILIQNMKSNDIKTIVFTKFGQAIPINDDDEVLP